MKSVLNVMTDRLDRLSNKFQSPIRFFIGTCWVPVLAGVIILLDMVTRDWRDVNAPWWLQSSGDSTFIHLWANVLVTWLVFGFLFVRIKPSAAECEALLEDISGLFFVAVTTVYLPSVVSRCAQLQMLRDMWALDTLDFHVDAEGRRFRVRRYKPDNVMSEAWLIDVRSISERDEDYVLLQQQPHPSLTAAVLAVRRTIKTPLEE